MSPHTLIQGGHTRLREKGWGSPSSDEGTYTVVLCTSTLWLQLTALSVLIFSVEKFKHLLLLCIEKATHLSLNINDINDKFVAGVNSTIDQSVARVVEKGKKHELMLTRIPIPSRLYLIDMGNEGRARDSRTP